MPILILSMVQLGALTARPSGEAQKTDRFIVQRLHVLLVPSDSAM